LLIFLIALPPNVSRSGEIRTVKTLWGAPPNGEAVDFDSTMRRFESSRPSHAVRQLEIAPTYIWEMPVNGGPFQI
jgi:hypothetical protein